MSIITKLPQAGNTTIIHHLDGTLDGPRRLRDPAGVLVVHAFRFTDIAAEVKNKERELDVLGSYLIANPVEAYIGEGKVSERLLCHSLHPDKQFAEQVFAITGYDEFVLGKPEIQFLQWYLTKLGDAAGLVKIRRKQEPIEPSLRQDEKVALVNMMQSGFRLLFAAGCRVFNDVDPGASASSRITPVVAETPVQGLETDGQDADGQIADDQGAQDLDAEDVEEQHDKEQIAESQDAKDEKAKQEELDRLHDAQLDADLADAFLDLGPPRIVVQDLKTIQPIQLYELNYNTIRAYGFQVGEWFVVGAGSEFALGTNVSAQERTEDRCVLTWRSEYLEPAGNQAKDRLRSIAPLYFKSMAVAAKTVCGAHVNSSHWVPVMRRIAIT